MEHTITINNSREASNVVTALQFFRTHWQTICNLAPYVPALSVATVDFTAEDLNMLGVMQDQFSEIFKAEQDAEKPKYEHRYAIRDYGGNMIQEYDNLKDAFDVYAEYYQEDYKDSPNSVSDGVYQLYDNKTEQTVTRFMPSFDVEFEWSADINISFNGHDFDVDEVPTWVRDNILSSMKYGDDYGYVSDTVGDVTWDDICDWEGEHDESEVTVSAEEERETY